MTTVSCSSFRHIADFFSRTKSREDDVDRDHTVRHLVAAGQCHSGSQSVRNDSSPDSTLPPVHRSGLPERTR